MRRNPIYVFEDLQSIGIYNVPIGSTIQINDADDLTPGSQPLIVQVVDKNGLGTASTIGEFLGDPANYSNASDSTEIPSELEKLSQNNKTGWRILYANTKEDPNSDNLIPIDKYGEIGKQAIDLTQVNKEAPGSATYGASGDYSFSAGFESKASGLNSVAIGNGAQAIVDNTVAIGTFNTANNPTALLEFGIGQSASDRKDGLVLFADGTLEAPNASTTLISNRGAFALVTKEYVDLIDAAKVNRAGDHMTGNLYIDGADLNVRKDQSNGGNAIFEGVITVGAGAGNKSTVYFNGTTTHSIFYSNDYNEFQLETPATGPQKIWHSGNMGANSTLDADLLDGMQPLELPISDAAQLALDGKYDKTGGTISGNVTLNGTLDVSGDVSLTSNVSISTIVTDITFQQSANITNNLIVGGAIDATTANFGLNSSNKSGITLKDSDTNNRPAIYWNNNSGYKDFFVDTDTANSYVIWHAGNFDPNTKYDKTGGTISGNVDINGYINVGTNAEVIGNLTIQGTSLLNGNIQANNDLTVGNQVKADSLDITHSATVGGEFNLGGSAHVTGTGIFAGGLNITGTSTFDGETTFTGNSTFNNDLSVSGNTSITGTLAVADDISTDKTISLGYDTNNNSVINFKDLGGRTPVLFWNKDQADFYINIDTATATSGVIWHAGNLDPTDETVFPKHFDALADTPNNKTNSAGKYLRVSTDETKIEYVDVPDDSALWGNITGNIDNQQDLIDRLNLKFDKAGGTITGNLQVNGVSVFNEAVTFNKKITARDEAEFEKPVTMDETLDVTGVATFDNSVYFLRDIRINGDLDAQADAYLRGDTWLSGDLGVQGTTTLQGNVSAQNDLTIQNNLNVQLSSLLNGSITGNSSLTIAGVTTLNDKLNANADVDIQGLTRIYDDLQIQGDIIGHSDMSLTGDLRVSGTSSLTGDVVAGANITVTDNITVNKQSNLIQAVHLQDTLDVAGTSSFVGDVSMANSLTTGTTLSVGTHADISGNLTVAGTVGITGNTTLSNNLDVGGDLTITGLTTLNNGLDVTGNITSTGNGDFAGNLTVGGTSLLTGAVTAQNNVTIAQNLDVQGELNVDNDATFGNNIEVNSNITTHQNLIVDHNSTVDGLTIGRGAASFEDTLTVTDLVTANGGVQVNGAATLNGSLDVALNTTLSGNLNVVGDSNFDKIPTVDYDDGVNAGAAYNVLHLGEYRPDTAADTNGKWIGLATLDENKKIPVDQLPAISISEVYVVNTIADRDALTAQTGDVCKVADTNGDGTNLPSTYIFDGTSWVDIQETSDVVSVNGKTGTVTLTTDDISEGSTNLYYTDARADARVQAANLTDLNNVDTTGVATDDVLVWDGTQWIPDGRVTANTTKLSGIEDNATADQTGAEIKSLYEAEADTNAFTDAEKAKLGGIAAGAEVNVQSDWNETDNNSDAFIVNKPTDITDLSTHNIGELSNVDTSTTAPTNGQVLKWDGTNWVPADDADTDTTYTAGTGLSLTGTTFALDSVIDNLTDVDTTTTAPTNGQVLKWDGTNWVPADDTDTTVQNELDTTQAGAGLNTDGTYTADGSANYISGATSLSNADVLLDTQIKTNADNIAAIKSRNTQDETGDGAITDFTISGVVVGNSDIDVFLDGVMQKADGTIYSVTDDGTDTTISFSTAPANGAWIRFNYYA